MLAPCSIYLAVFRLCWVWVCGVWTSGVLTSDNWKVISSQWAFSEKPRKPTALCGIGQDIFFGQDFWQTSNERHFCPKVGPSQSNKDIYVQIFYRNIWQHPDTLADPRLKNCPLKPDVIVLFIEFCAKVHHVIVFAPPLLLHIVAYMQCRNDYF